jgi:hypothetical protein
MGRSRMKKFCLGPEPQAGRTKKFCLRPRPHKKSWAAATLFNTETLTWQDTGIVVYGEVLSYSFDQNEILTLKVAKGCLAKNSTFYRFALK